MVVFCRALRLVVQRVARGVPSIVAVASLLVGAQVWASPPGSGNEEGAAQASSAPLTEPLPPIFVRSNTSSLHVYEGEQIVNSLVFYSRIINHGAELLPHTVEGFWQEDFPGQLASAKQVNGADYHVIEIRRALFPLRSGELPLAPLVVRARVPTLVDQRGSRRVIHVGAQEFSSEPETITVEPLPSPPSEFIDGLGAVPLVGATAFKLSYSLDSISLGESKSVVLTLSSAGNINPVKSLKVPAPPHVKVYEDTREVRFHEEGGRLEMSRRFVYTFVPVRPGPVRIQGPRLAYFDPQRKSYQWAEAPPVAFFVLEGASAAHEDEERVEGSQPKGTALQSAPSEPTLSDLSYQEPTRLSRVLAYTSPSSIALIGFLVGVAIALVRIARRGTLSLRRPSVGMREIDAATSVDAVEQLLFRLVHDLVPNLSPENSTDEMRALAGKTIPDPRVRFSILALIDEVEIAHYQRADGEQEGLVPRLQAKLRELLATLSS